MPVIMIIQNNSQRLADDAEGDPKDHVPHQRLLQLEMQFLCDEDQWHLEGTRHRESRQHSHKASGSMYASTCQGRLENIVTSAFER